MKISTLVIDSNEFVITHQTAFPNMFSTLTSFLYPDTNLQCMDSGREDLSNQTNIICKIHSELKKSSWVKVTKPLLLEQFF